MAMVSAPWSYLKAVALLADRATFAGLLMAKFLYLREAKFADAWIDGGEVPLSLASAYRAAERRGVLTPDENRVLRIRDNLAQPAMMVPHAEHEAHTVMWLAYDEHGNIVPRALDTGFVDGVLLCLSNVRNDDEWRRRANKRACVQIDRVEELELSIAAQLGEQGLFDGIRGSAGIRSHQGPCRYTDTAQRDVFLKSVDDAWQDEYRLIWYVLQPVRVRIPRGTASLVWRES